VRGNWEIQFEFAWGPERNSSSGLIAHARNIPLQTMGILSSPLLRPQFLNDVHQIFTVVGNPKVQLDFGRGRKRNSFFGFIGHARNIPMHSLGIFEFMVCNGTNTRVRNNVYLVYCYNYFTLVFKRCNNSSICVTRQLRPTRVLTAGDHITRSRIKSATVLVAQVQPTRPIDCSSQ
jgi:hypothetical protein